MSSRGVVAVGDSLIDGHADSMAAVPSHSIGFWVALAADEPFSIYARGGIDSNQIVTEQLPRVNDQYRYGLFDMGTNDAFNGSLSDLAANVRTAALMMRQHCDTVAMLSVPYSQEANGLVTQAAREFDIPVIDASVKGARLLGTDGIHLTALGYLEVADRLASVWGTPLPSLLAKNAGRGSLGTRWWANYAVNVAYSSARSLARTARKVARG